jgi:hypothetical protein
LSIVSYPGKSSRQRINSEFQSLFNAHRLDIRVHPDLPRDGLVDAMLDETGRSCRRYHGRGTNMNRGHATRWSASSTRVLALIVGAVWATLLAPATPAHALVAEGPAIWVGSPVDATWGLPDDASTTPAGPHHLLANADPSNDWAVDLTNVGSDRAVYIYAAPNDTSLNDRISATVTQITASCRNGGGGQMITVEFYLDGSLPVGSATYAHLDLDPSMYVGRPVSRWGTYLGQAGNSFASDPNCWTGPHVHLELRSDRHYACWNRGYSDPGHPLYRTNFVGFVGGDYAGDRHQPCP